MNYNDEGHGNKPMAHAQPTPTSTIYEIQSAYFSLLRSYVTDNLQTALRMAQANPDPDRTILVKPDSCSPILIAGYGGQILDAEDYRILRLLDDVVDFGDSTRSSCTLP